MSFLDVFLGIYEGGKKFCFIYGFTIYNQGLSFQMLTPEKLYIVTPEVPKGKPWVPMNIHVRHSMVLKTSRLIDIFKCQEVLALAATYHLHLTHYGPPYTSTGESR